MTPSELAERFYMRSLELRVSAWLLAISLDPRFRP